MSDTKTKIVTQAKELFYKDGIANVRLQQLADAVGISVGNLAYHFKNKEAIVEAVYENIFTRLTEILSAYSTQKNFIGLNKQLEELFSFNKTNPFISNNSWEIDRNYPKIQKEWLSLNNKIKLQLAKRIEACVAAGLLKKELLTNNTDQLSQVLLFSINCWIPQQTLMKKAATSSLFKKAIWSILTPYFTLEGADSYQKEIRPAFS